MKSIVILAFVVSTAVAVPAIHPTEELPKISEIPALLNALVKTDTVSVAFGDKWTQAQAKLNEIKAHFVLYAVSLQRSATLDPKKGSLLSYMVDVSSKKALVIFSYMELQILAKTLTPTAAEGFFEELAEFANGSTIIEITEAWSKQGYEENGSKALLHAGDAYDWGITVVKRLVKQFIEILDQ